MLKCDYVNPAFYDLLKEFIGKKFVKFKMDPIEYSPVSIEHVGLYIGEKIYELSAKQKKINRFFSEDEVALFNISEAKESDLVSRLEGVDFIDVPVNEVVKSIFMVVDTETVTHNVESREMKTVKALVFGLEGGNEVSFEISEWFSDIINVEKGYELIEKVQSIDDFLEEWEDCEEYVPSVTREIVKIE